MNRLNLFFFIFKKLFTRVEICDTINVWGYMFMEMKDYKLIVKSDLYKANFTIRATGLKDASKKAKIKFAQKYHVFGTNVKVALDPSDLRNHIVEIMETLQEGN
jgi:hypothetical protein